jgi:hypothetical protein
MTTADTLPPHQPNRQPDRQSDRRLESEPLPALPRPPSRPAPPAPCAAQGTQQADWSGARPDAVAARSTGTRRPGSIAVFLALVGGLATGGVAAALALSRPAAEDGATGSAGAVHPVQSAPWATGAGPDLLLGVGSAQVSDQESLIGPGGGAPAGASHGS